MDHRRIYLTGFMGSGKSTIGAMLAQKLGYDFLDLDKNIEEVTGMSIPEIFHRVGEHGFREIEEHALRATAALSNVVIATGGGAVAQTAAVHFVTEHGLGVYLDVPEDVLVSRLSESIDRPLLFGRNSTAEYVSSKLGERRVFYEAMHVRLPAGSLTPSQIVERLSTEIPI